MVRRRVKVILIGKWGCGKTCLYNAIRDGLFDENVPNTVGGQACERILLDQAGEQIKAEIWDTAGHERYGALLPVFLRGAHIVLLCFAVDDNESLERARNLPEAVRERREAGGCDIFLCGCKSDLPQAMDNQQMEAVRAAVQAQELYVTSARTKEGVPRLCTAIAARAVARAEAGDRGVVENRRGGCC